MSRNKSMIIIDDPGEPVTKEQLEKAKRWFKNPIFKKRLKGYHGPFHTRHKK